MNRRCNRDDERQPRKPDSISTPKSLPNGQRPKPLNYRSVSPFLIVTAFE